LDLIDLILTLVVGVIRKWFRFSPDDLDPEKAALCSEAPNEDALVLCRGPRERVILLLRQKKNQGIASKRSQENGLVRISRCDMKRFHGTEFCSNKNFPYHQGAIQRPEKFPPPERYQQMQRHPMS